ncbi:hypothetical protein Tco_1127700 [Tanacetum coccineum]
MTDASVGSVSSSGITGKIYKPYYSSINALVESELSRSDASPACSPSNICVANGHIKSEHISSVDSFSTKCISSQQVLPPATHISGDNKGATFGSELNTRDDDAHLNSSNAAPASKVKPVGLIGDASTVLSFVDATNGGKEGAKVETQGNEESASWSSSDKTEKSRNIFTRPLTAKLMS